MPNAPVIEAWARALESGDYTQGYGELKHAYSDAAVVQHCCLGVLCELAVNDGVIPDSERPHDGLGSYAFGRYTASLPWEVVAWAGLDSVDPKVDYDDDLNNNLSTVNDVGGFDFDAIAEIIRKNFLSDER